MISEARFKVNMPSVTHETIEGESVIINLETGNYYSLQATGSEIWESLAANTDVASIVEDLSARYSARRAQIEQSVVQLIGELRREELIVPDGAMGTSVARLPLVASTVKAAEFQAPVLQKFTDMQELLLLDPIHEVDAAGWPRAKQNP
jgi:Coenzyme PQQ synthesis protein D (PqqD)